MPRVSTKKTKVKTEEPSAVASPELNGGTAPETAVIEPPVPPEPELQPPSTPVEPTAEEPKEEERRGPQRDKIAASLNIAKLQAMQMAN